MYCACTPPHNRPNFSLRAFFFFFFFFCYFGELFLREMSSVEPRLYYLCDYCHGISGCGHRAHACPLAEALLHRTCVDCGADLLECTCPREGALLLANLLLRKEGLPQVVIKETMLGDDFASRNVLVELGEGHVGITWADWATEPVYVVWNEEHGTRIFADPAKAEEWATVRARSHNKAFSGWAPAVNWVSGRLLTRSTQDQARPLYSSAPVPTRVQKSPQEEMPQISESAGQAKQNQGYFGLGF